MRRLFATLIALFAVTTAGAAEPSRTLTLEQPSKGLTGIVVQSGIGDVEVVAQDAPTVAVEVEVTAKHVSFFSSSGAAAVENATIVAERTGSTLHLRVDTPDRDNHGFSERWSIRLPATLAVRLKLGVGDVRVLDMKADLEVEVGVGDVRLESTYEAFGPLRARAGVGDVKLRTPEGRQTGEGFISRSLDSRGRGTAEADIRVGVGDIDIRLR